MGERKQTDHSTCAWALVVYNGAKKGPYQWMMEWSGFTLQVTSNVSSTPSSITDLTWGEQKYGLKTAQSSTLE